MSGTTVHKHTPDRVKWVISLANVQQLFGLAELSKSMIWPQCNAEPTNLSREKKRPTVYAVYGVTAEPPHFFTTTDNMRNTQCVFSISPGVLFIYSSISLFLFPH